MIIQPFKTLLFDLDGTLVDTAADFVKVIQDLCAADNIQAPSPSTIRNTVSDGARALVTLSFGLNEGENGFEEKRQALLDAYEAELGNNADLFEGFDQVLSKLSANNKTWGIVTNKPWRFTEPLIQKLFTSEQRQAYAPNIIICPDHVKQTKPDPEGLLLACAHLAIKPEECLYIGDHIRDIEAGKNANMPTVACSFGYIKDEDNVNDWQADWVIDSPLALL